MAGIVTGAGGTPGRSRLNTFLYLAFVFFGVGLWTCHLRLGHAFSDVIGAFGNGRVGTFGLEEVLHEYIDFEGGDILRAVLRHFFRSFLAIECETCLSERTCFARRNWK